MRKLNLPKDKIKKVELYNGKKRNFRPLNKKILYAIRKYNGNLLKEIR